MLSIVLSLCFSVFFFNFIHLMSSGAVYKCCHPLGGLTPNDDAGCLGRRELFPNLRIRFNALAGRPDCCTLHFPSSTSMQLYIYGTWMFSFRDCGWLFGNYSWKEHNSLMLLCGLCLLWPISNYVALLQVLVELVIIQKPGSIFNHYFMIWFDLLSSFD